MRVATSWSKLGKTKIRELRVVILPKECSQHLKSTNR
jgi:hypothetical protein